jgi:CheY-like chemotaxis protein
MRDRRTAADRNSTGRICEPAFSRSVARDRVHPFDPAPARFVPGTARPAPARGLVDRSRRVALVGRDDALSADLDLSRGELAAALGTAREPRRGYCSCSAAPGRASPRETGSTPPAGSRGPTERLGRGEADAIVTDVRMPELDGPAPLQRVRREDRDRHG